MVLRSVASRFASTSFLATFRPPMTRVRIGVAGAQGRTAGASASPSRAAAA